MVVGRDGDAHFQEGAEGRLLLVGVVEQHGGDVVEHGDVVGVGLLHQRNLITDTPSGP